MSKSKIDLSDMPPLERRLSLEETFSLVDRARRKSSDKTVHDDLRLRISHSNVLNSALKEIAARSPPPSPIQSTCSPYSIPNSKPASITWATQIIVSHVEEGDYDDYGFSYDNDGQEDISDLALTRTTSIYPKQ